METTGGSVSADTGGGSDTTAPVEDQAAPDTKQEVQAQVKAQKERIKLKVDGEEIEEEIDWNDRDSRIKDRQLSLAAKKRMGEAQAEKRKAFEIIKAFESDPESMLKRLGPKGREIAEKFLLAQINDEMLTPEQKELRALKNENETYKQKDAREKAEREAQVAQQKENEYAQSFQKTIIEALNKSGLPKTPELVKRMAAMMSKNLEYGLELSPDDLVAEVKSDLTALFKSIVGDADGDHLIGMFGDDVANKIRKSDIKKLMEKHGQVYQPGKKVEPVGGSSSEPSRPMSMDDWRESVNRRIK